MTDDLQLALLSIADAPILSALHAEGFPEPWPVHAFTSLLNDPHRSGALALRNEEPAGFVMLQQVADEAEVLTLVVASAYRRSGIARKLLEWALAAAAAADASRVVLEVSEQNHAARALYRGLGFVEIGQRSGYYPRAGGLETAYVLACSVVRAAASR